MLFVIEYVNKFNRNTKFFITIYKILIKNIVKIMNKSMVESNE